MKKLVFAFATLALLATACKPTNSTDATASATTPTTASAFAGEKIAYVNTDSLNTKYKFLIDTKKTIEAKVRNAQKDMEGRTISIQKEMQEAQANVQNMSPNERETVGAKLQKRQEDLERYRQQLAETMDKEQSELDKIFRGKVNEVIKRIAQENGYTYILSYTSAGVGVLYGESSRDVTDKVLTELNAMYEKEKK